mmetsp:Transcript_11216/g.37155  ORF Transcript_11216/g.37155 Transcript_11216/m.37155 type:complete len:312 (+) Transcript_11216:893-1828(+)
MLVLVAVKVVPHIEQDVPLLLQRLAPHLLLQHPQVLPVAHVTHYLPKLLQRLWACVWLIARVLVHRLAVLQVCNHIDQHAPLFLELFSGNLRLELAELLLSILCGKLLPEQRAGSLHQTEHFLLGVRLVLLLLLVVVSLRRLGRWRAGVPLQLIAAGGRDSSPYRCCPCAHCSLHHARRSEKIWSAALRGLHLHLELVQHLHADVGEVDHSPARRAVYRPKPWQLSLQGIDRKILALALAHGNLSAGPRFICPFGYNAITELEPAERVGKPSRGPHGDRARQHVAAGLASMRVRDPRGGCLINVKSSFFFF